MHRRTLLISLGLAGMASQATAAAASGPVAVIEAFHAALKRGDAAAAAALLGENATIFEQGGAEASKAEYVTGHLPGDIAYSAVTKDEVTSRKSEVTGSLAVVMSQGRTTGEYNGKPVDRRTTETMVLKRTRSVWRIIHVHWSSRAS